MNLNTCDLEQLWGSAHLTVSLLSSPSRPSSTQPSGFTAAEGSVLVAAHLDAKSLNPFLSWRT